MFVLEINAMSGLATLRRVAPIAGLALGVDPKTAAGIVDVSMMLAQLGQNSSQMRVPSPSPQGGLPPTEAQPPGQASQQGSQNPMQMMQMMYEGIMKILAMLTGQGQGQGGAPGGAPGGASGGAGDPSQGGSIPSSGGAGGPSPSGPPSSGSPSGSASQQGGPPPPQGDQNPVMKILEEILNKLNEILEKSSGGKGDKQASGKKKDKGKGGGGGIGEIISKVLGGGSGGGIGKLL